jgi:hypothetical protein
MSHPKKHHYIPVFYLKQWAGPHGNLCEYSRPYKALKCKWRDPHATGYKEGLYTVPGLPPGDAEYIERFFMGMTDDLAAKTLRILLSWGENGVQALTPDERISWARFIYALAVRTPDDLERQKQKYIAALPELLEEYRERYPKLRTSGDPDSFDEFKLNYLAKPRNTSPLPTLPSLLSSERVLPAIAQMQFKTVRLKQLAPLTFLTSDRPYIMTNGLSQPDAHIALPISPTVLFLAANNDAAYRHLMSLSARKLAATVNNRVVEQAYNYVYGADEGQVDFVDRRLGKRVPASPLG